MVSDLFRWLFVRFKLTDTTANLFCSLFAGSVKAISFFAAKVNQKYFMRNIKNMEQIAESTGNLKAINPNFYIVFGQIYVIAREYLYATGKLNVCCD